jgi:hypothetical protein
VSVGRDQRERFLIVGAGRTGSSLLSAVLAAAGGDFGMPADQAWEVDGGAFEQAAVTRAAAWFAVADQFGAARPIWPHRWLWDVARHQAKAQLRRALAAARFVKGPNLDLAVQLTAKLGYVPRIVVSHRAFAAQAMSHALRSTNVNAVALEANYLRTYKNALMWLHVYGGCVVGFDELVDLDRSEWLDALAEVTGLPRQRMAAARRAQFTGREPRAVRLPSLSAECDHLHACLGKLSGRVVPPSHLAARAPAYRPPSCSAAA